MAAETRSNELPFQVQDYLRRHNILTLATASATGVPHATTVLYVNDGPTLYFCTLLETATARNLDENPAVAFAIDEDYADWGMTRGIQGSGEARVVIDPARIRQVVALFQAKFPKLTDMKTTDLSVFRVNPSEIDFIDNEDGSAEEVGRAFGVGYRRRTVYSVFQELPGEESESIAGKLDTVQVEAGATIVRQGAPADKFFIIIEGEVEVVREDQGVARTVATLQRGQFFGEIAVLRDIPRTATVRALAPTRLLTMDRDAF